MIIQELYIIKSAHGRYNITATQKEAQKIVPVQIVKGLYLFQDQTYLGNPLKEEVHQETLDWPNVEQQSAQERPQTFKDYVGQNRAKKLLKLGLAVNSQDMTNFEHVLIFGASGLGKTTLSKIIISKLKSKVVEMVGGNLQKIEDVDKYLHQLDYITEGQGNILFIDEIHGMTKEAAEYLYSAMEDGKLGGKQCPKFTVIGATTDIDTMIKNYEPLINRFEYQIQLEFYTQYQLAKIILNLSDRLDFIFNVSDVLMLAKLCRKTARTAVRYTKLVKKIMRYNNRHTVIKQDIIDLMDLEGLSAQGLTKQDRKVLQVLAGDKVIGISGLSQAIKVKPQIYLYQIEPFLVSEGYIERTSRGRKITEKGKGLLW